MRTAAKTLVGIFLLLVAMVTALLAAPLLFGPFEIDLSGHRELIKGWVREHSGWEVEIEQGPVLELSRRVRVAAEGVRLENPGWKGRRQLVKAGELAVAVDLLPLLLGKLEYGWASVVDAEIQVDKDPSGRVNWRPGAAVDQKQDRRVRWDVPEQLDLRVENSVVKYRDRASGVEFTLRIKKATAFSPVDDADIQLEVDSDLDGTPLDLSGRIGSLPVLFSGDEPYPIDIEANLLGVRVQAQGTIANPLSGVAVAASVQIQGESLAGLKPWLGEQGASIGPVKGRMELQGGANAYKLDPIELDLGKGQILGRVQLDTSRAKPQLTAAITAQQLDARPLFPEPAKRKGAAPDDSTQESEGEGMGRATSETRKLFSREPLALHWLDAMDANLELKAKAVRSPWSVINDFHSSLKLQNRRLELDVKGHFQGDRRLALKARIDAQTPTPSFSFSFEGDKYRLEPLVALTDARGLIEGQLEILVQLEGRGRSEAEVMGSLDGKVLTVWDDAKADVKGLDRLIGGAGALLGQLVKPKDELAVVNCGVLSLTFEQGQGRVEGLFDTRYSTVVAKGDLDLRTETVALRVQPKSKGVTLSVAAPVNVKGPLADPKTTVEATGVLFKLTDLLTKLAIPHLIFVDAFGDAVSDNPCIALAAGRAQPAATSTVEGAAGAVTSETGSLIKGAGKAVKGAIGRGSTLQPEPGKDPAKMEPSPKKDSGLPEFP